MSEKTSKESEKKPCIILFLIIFAAVIVSLFIHGIFMLRTATAFVGGGLSSAIFFIPVLFFVFVGLIILFFIFILICRSRFRYYINIYSVSVFSIILAVIIIVPSFNFYIDIAGPVPPDELLNKWMVDEGYEIENYTSAFFIHIYLGGDKGGYFYSPDLDRINISYSSLTGQKKLDNSSFKWTYEESNNILNLRSREFISDFEWSLKLRLYLNISKYSFDTMKTFYVSDSNFTFFNPLLFNNVSWTGLTLKSFL